MTENGCSEDLPCSQQRIPRLDLRDHVSAEDPTKEGRQDARLLERCREQARGRRGGRTAPRSHLGEINSSQAAGWRKAIEVLDDDAGLPRTLALFPEDRCAAVASDASIVQLRLSDMRLCRPRQWGACWLAGQLWRDLRLEQFWAERLPPNRKGYAMGSGLACAGLVSIDRTGQRVEVAPRLVRQERHGRPVGGGLRTGGGAQAYA